jgi:hypothetical protein
MDPTKKLSGESSPTPLATLSTELQPVASVDEIGDFPQEPVSYFA